MDKTEEKKGRELAPEEEKDYREGMALYEMDQTNPGWAVIKKILEEFAFHTWVDPRATESRAEWEWKELNAFHAANNARELIDLIQTKISRADYLGKVKSGEIEVKRATIR